MCHTVPFVTNGIRGRKVCERVNETETLEESRETGGTCKSVVESEVCVGCGGELNGKPRCSNCGLCVGCG
jgi:hypothetical protein